jgi:hypothetical protein
MTTFTLRVSDVMAARLNSAETRTWLDAFLRDPHDILGDPGPGWARVSLTLPEVEVKGVAAYLQCTPSSALRRLAGEHLGTPGPMTAPVSHVIAPGPAVSKRMTPKSPVRKRRLSVPSGTTEPNLEQDNKIRLRGGEVLVVGLFILVFLSVMSWVSDISRKKKTNKQHDTHDATTA